jgi:hypothetical protein
MFLERGFAAARVAHVAEARVTADVHRAARLLDTGLCSFAMLAPPNTRGHGSPR